MLTFLTSGLTAVLTALFPVFFALTPVFLAGDLTGLGALAVIRAGFAAGFATVLALGELEGFFAAGLEAAGALLLEVDLGLGEGFFGAMKSSNTRLGLLP